MDIQSSEYLRKSEKLSKIVFACSKEAQVVYKRGQKSRDIVPLIWKMHKITRESEYTVWKHREIKIKISIQIPVEIQYTEQEEPKGLKKENGLKNKLNFNKKALQMH